MECLHTMLEAFRPALGWTIAGLLINYEHRSRACRLLLGMTRSACSVDATVRVLSFQGWDAAIRKLFNHQHGKVPANNLARRHPFVLNMRIPPHTWAKEAQSRRLPRYDWEAVLADMQQDIGISGNASTQPQSPPALAAMSW